MNVEQTCQSEPIKDQEPALGLALYILSDLTGQRAFDISFSGISALLRGKKTLQFSFLQTRI